MSQFVVATPVVGVVENIEAATAGGALDRVRESGAFDQGMTELMGGCDFESLVNGIVTYVIDPGKQTVFIYDMDLSWEVR